jgi:predicted RNase H-like HicB family nuclease
MRRKDIAAKTMTIYHVTVRREDGWYIGRVLERAGVTTQGRSLDELVNMLRDAIQLMWSEVDVQLELILSPDRTTAKRKRVTRSRAIA